MVVVLSIVLIYFIVAYFKAQKKLKQVGQVDDYCKAAKERAEKCEETAEERVKKSEEAVELLEKKYEAIKREMENYRKQAQKEIETTELNLLVGMVKIDEYDGLKSDEVKNKLTMLRGQQDELVKSGSALNVTNTTAKKSELNNQKKQILRCFNAECKSLIECVTVKNIDTIRAKIQRSYETINKIFAVDGVQIAPRYLESKYEELGMVYAYMQKEDEEREQRKAIREQMVEEEKVRREIEQAKQKIEKEENQFKNEVNKLMSYMQKAKDEIERKLYTDKIEELQKKLDALETSKEDVLKREQNNRAGFVYIISNIGSFGERVFKIGMTRRLEPMDRIAELSSASVPFSFDVHALIFSDDAPALEAILHQNFDAARVNKVNKHKEFFKTDLEAIKDIVLKNHNATVKFVDVPDAIEYRETLKIEGE